MVFWLFEYRGGVGYLQRQQIAAMQLALWLGFGSAHSGQN